MPYKRPQCNQSGCPNNKNLYLKGYAEYSLFAREIYLESRLHVEKKDGSPTHCKDCIRRALNEDESKEYVGCLEIADSKKYAKACAPDGPASRFRTEGLAVIKKSEASSAVKPVAYSLMEYIGVKSNVDYLADSMQEGGYKNHDGRKWQNIYPGEGRHDYKDICKRIKDASLPLITLIEQCICPHDCYARNAARRGAGIKSCRENQTDTEFRELLTLRRINLLLRDHTLQYRQSLHIDGTDFGIIVIIVEKCGPDGYDFHYIPKSHNRFQTHNRHVWVPKSAVRQPTLERGDLLVFAPSLIHAGGKASSPRPTGIARCGYIEVGHFIPPAPGGTQNEERYKNIGGYDKWTDVSFQFTLSHASDPMCELGRGQNIWFIRDEQKHEETELQGQRYHKVQVDGAEFQRYIEEGGSAFEDTLNKAFETWLAILSGKAKHITRKRSHRSSTAMNMVSL